MGILAKHNTKEKEVNMMYFKIIMGMVGIWILFIASAQLFSYVIKLIIKSIKK